MGSDSCRICLSRAIVTTDGTVDADLYADVCWCRGGVHRHCLELYLKNSTPAGLRRDDDGMPTCRTCEMPFEIELMEKQKSIREWSLGRFMRDIIFPIANILLRLALISFTIYAFVLFMEVLISLDAKEQQWFAAQEWHANQTTTVSTTPGPIIDYDADEEKNTTSKLIFYEDGKRVLEPLLDRKVVGRFGVYLGFDFGLGIAFLFLGLMDMVPKIKHFRDDNRAVVAIKSIKMPPARKLVSKR